MSKPTVSLIILCTLCFLLLIIRMYLTGIFLGFFLIWNFFLAILPLIFILIAKKNNQINGTKTVVSKGITWTFVSLWLLFLPNAPYIITDLIHLGHLPKHLLWFDSLAIFVVALTALFVGLYSVYILQMLIRQFFNKVFVWLFVMGSLVLSSFGLYLGRFVRFNSWDLFTHPSSLIKQSFFELYNPLAIQTTVVFSIVLIGLYLSFYNFIKPQYESIKNAQKL
jgi:uncharacterized membrane protein